MLGRPLTSEEAAILFDALTGLMTDDADVARQ